MTPADRRTAADGLRESYPVSAERVCGLIGLERTLHGRPAGFRTHVLVCVGSAVYMIVSVAVAGDRFDPGRIAAQVASGMGFLGAGTIIKQGSLVRGLTTAASLWAVAAIGLAVGYGWPTMGVALLGTLVVLLALSALKALEIHIGRGQAFHMQISLTNARQQVAWVRQSLAAYGIELSALSVQGGDGGGEVAVEGHASSRDALGRLAAEIAGHENVLGVRWESQ